MANYLVDSTDLTTVADAIRTKGGTSAQLEFPDGFVDAVEAIETGGGGGTAVTGEVTTVEALTSLTIDVGIELHFFWMGLNTANSRHPGYKSFSMVSSNGNRWCALGSNNAGTQGAEQTSVNINGNKIVFSGTEVQITATGASGTVLGSIQPGTWRWFAC